MVVMATRKQNRQMMKSKRRRGRANSEPRPTIEELIENCKRLAVELIENCKRLAVELEKLRDELKQEMYECAKP